MKIYEGHRFGEKLKIGWRETIDCLIYNNALPQNSHFRMDFSIFNVYESIIFLGLLFTMTFL